eukprot:20051_6
MCLMKKSLRELRSDGMGAADGCANAASPSPYKKLRVTLFIGTHMFMSRKALDAVALLRACIPLSLYSSLVTYSVLHMLNLLS